MTFAVLLAPLQLLLPGADAQQLKPDPLSN
jgi:hypothetical protein